MLRRDAEYVVLRSRAERGANTVLVVATASQQPQPRSIERLKHEHALRDNLHPAWAAQPLTLAEQDGRSLLVLADPGGALLSSLLGKPWDIGTFLRVAIGMAVALGRVHAQGLIHKDVKPDHFMVDLATGAAWLTGFGITSRLARERQAPDLPETIAGTLAYMAPEQTGRMNRSVDARSDLYALGVTLYEMLTGMLPFTASDPMEWIHCHIARQPMPPDERVNGVPAPVAAIVMKLLAKTGEDRYQTAAGVAADLQYCLTTWDGQRRVDPFPLGAHDMSGRLLISEKLYGREAEIDALVAAFDRVVSHGTAELVLVSGYSGIGKSSVVNELHKVLVPPRGLFASGKFDQYKRDIPYATLAQAFQSLVRQLLSKNDAELAPWRTALLEALGVNGSLMVDLIPELALIVGEQPPVAELPPQEAQSRFQQVFRRFLAVFAHAEHPLALFLDDLQWLDRATLDLIEHLSTHPEVRHLLLIGAYRDNEVGPSHPLIRTLGAIRSAKGSVQEIVLAPLMLRDVGRLAVDALHCEPVIAQPLVRLVHEKTRGNPFFTIQFLTLLADEALLAFDHGAAAWSWDTARIRAKGFTENVVDFMAAKLNRLPDTTRDFLGKLACLGNSGQTRTLSTVLGVPEDEIHAALWGALRAGLISRRDGAYGFLHDRVHEAAYALISEDERVAVHLRIGRTLAAQTTPAEIDKNIFEIVNQLDRGAALIQSPEERQQVADLNLRAGKRARTSTAYASALTYFAAGRALLGEDCWERQYPLVFDLELHLAECEFLTGELGSAEKRLAALVRRTADVVHRAAVTRLRLAVYMTLDRPDRAIEVGLEYLRHVGIEWSQQPSEEDVRQEFERLGRLLGGRSIEQLIDLPLMSDPGYRATMDVLSGLFAPTLLTDSNLYDLVVLRMTTLSLEHGNYDASCYAYSHINRVLGFRFGDYQAALRFGQLACDLVQKRGLDRFEHRVYASFGAFATPWMRDVSTSRAFIKRGFDMANASGDLTYAVFGFKNLITNLLVSGEPLDDVQREAEQGLAYARKARFGFAIDWFTGQLMLIRALRGLSLDFDSPDNAGYGDGSYERHLKEDPPLALCTCTYWIHKLQACVLAQAHPAAIEAVTNAAALLWSTRSFLEAADYHFYGALTRAAACDTARREQRAQHLDALLNHHRQLTVWAENCPATFANRAALVSAEVARLEGRDLDAMRLYEEAIRSAREHGFIQNEGIANELAARFYGTRDFETIANSHLRNARYCYLRWGADAKVRQLDQLHPQLRGEPAPPRATSTISTPIEQLDLATVIEVSQAVGGEIVLEKLIDTLVRTAVEHAGAERGLLILAQAGEQRVAAEVTTAGDRVGVQLRDQAVAAATLPQSVFHFVLRTKQSVILDDAAAQSPFSSDPYILEHRARSVLCLPLLKQARVMGVLYLENRLAAGVFTPARIAVLNVLASQAAISLENARLYSDLQRENAERRQSEEALRRSEERYALAVQAAGDGHTDWIVATDELYASPRLLEMLGLPADTRFAGRADYLARVNFHPEDRERALRTVEEFYAGDSARVEFDVRILRAGETRWLHVTVLCTRDATGAVQRSNSAVTDITGRKLAEEELEMMERKLRQAQRLESMGTFAGGIAHDFNNILGAILGFGEIALGAAPKGGPLAGDLKKILIAGERGRALVRRLLTFSRSVVGERVPVHVERVVREALDVVSAKLPPGVTVQAELHAGRAAVLGDATQVHQVVTNLATNAIHSMPAGGTLRVELANLRFGAPRAATIGGLAAGEYVVLTVADTGAGIAPEIVERIFDPFFTTKEVGTGTGLGLSLVHGIVTEIGGGIDLVTRVGAGTTFTVYLPRSGEAAEVQGDADLELPRGEGQRVLVVDDEEPLVTVATRTLEELGYAPVGFTSSSAALAALRADPQRFDALITDERMPGVSGSALIREVRDIRSSMPVVLMSGYLGLTAGRVRESGAFQTPGMAQKIAAAIGADEVLQKPLSARDLAASLARVLRL